MQVINEEQELTIEINLPECEYDNNPLSDSKNLCPKIKQKKDDGLFKNIYTEKGLINMLLIIAQTCEECQQC